MKSARGRNRFLVACIAPAVILFFIFMILPTLNVFRMSLFQKGAYSPNETFVGLKNFQMLMTDSNFIRSMQNMILLTRLSKMLIFGRMYEQVSIRMLRKDFGIIFIQRLLLLILRCRLLRRWEILRG